MANAPKLLVPNGFNGYTEYNGVQVGGVANANQVPLLSSATGQLDPSMIPTTGGFTATAGSALTAPALINTYNNAGVSTMRYADNSLGYEADGFITSNVASGAVGTYYTTGAFPGTGLTPDAFYGLGTAGGVTTTAPTTPGFIIQPIGKSTSATAIPVTALPGNFTTCA